jgi:hypothetical protein
MSLIMSIEGRQFESQRVKHGKPNQQSLAVSQVHGQILHVSGADMEGNLEPAGLLPEYYLPRTPHRFNDIE